MTKNVRLVEAEKIKRNDVRLDPKGFFIIEIVSKEKKIRVEYYKNVIKENKIVSGSLQLVFIGKKADALCDTISKNINDLYPEHFMYVAREIQKAEFCLKDDKKYIQGGC